MAEITKAECPQYRKCGGCQLQNLSYAEQLSHKQALVIAKLGELGHVEEIIGMDSPSTTATRSTPLSGWTAGAR